MAARPAVEARSIEWAPLQTVCIHMSTPPLRGAPTTALHCRFSFFLSSDTGAFGRVTAFPHIGRYVMQLHRGRSATPRFRRAQSFRAIRSKISFLGEATLSLSASESEKAPLKRKRWRGPLTPPFCAGQSIIRLSRLTPRQFSTTCLVCSASAWHDQSPFEPVE